MDFSKDCDSRAAIESALFTLYDFEELNSARRAAYGNGNQKLTNWVVFGRFYLDKAGQLSIYTKGGNYRIPAEVYPNLPIVMTGDEFTQFIKNHNPIEDGISFGSSFFSLPPNHFFCPVCGEPWGISNCFDSVTNIEFQEFPLTEFIGKRLGEVKEIWSKKTTEMWHLQPDSPIQNDCYINHDIIDSEDGRKYHLEINKEGWIEAGNDYTIIPGDVARVNIWTFKHHKCDLRVRIENDRKFYQEVFEKAGFKSIHVIETTQVFLGEEHLHNKPWFQVLADDIAFRIGHKNSVIELRSNDYRIDFQTLLPNESVTTSTHYIHAWGSKQCTGFLSKIREALLSE